MTEKKRLLVLASTYPRWRDDPEPGFVHELSKRLTDHFDVTVLCPHAAETRVQERMDGVDIHRYRYAPVAMETLINSGGINGNLKKSPWKWLLVPGFLLSQWWHTLWLIRRLKPDVVHAHWLFPQALIAAIAGWMQKNIPLVVTSHGSDLYMIRGRLWRPVRAIIASRIKTLAVVGDAMCPVANVCFPGVDVRVMPMGVDLHGRFSPPDVNQRISGSILYIGRLVESKGLGFLIDAFAKVKSQRPDARLDVVGHGPDEEVFRQKVHLKGLEDSVFFKGALPNGALPEIYARCDLFVAPFVKAMDGKQEGLGLVLLEAIGSGCQVLTGRTDFSEAIGVDIVDVRDTDSFAATMLVLMAESSDARISKSSATRRKIVETYDWDVSTGRYLSLLDSIA